MVDPSIAHSSSSTSRYTTPRWLYCMFLSSLAITALFCLSMSANLPFRQLSHLRFLRSNFNGLRSFLHSSTDADFNPSSHLSPSHNINRTMVHLLTDHCTQLRFIPSLNMLVYSMAKGGSVSIWRNIYLGITGGLWQGRDHCTKVIQDPKSSCWKSLVHQMHFYDIEERHRILTDPSVFKIAIIRNPFERLISAYKDKFMCNERYTEDDSGRLRNAFFVNSLRKNANRPTTNSSTCMDIDEFAELIDAVRQNVGRENYVKRLDHVESHIRPQQYFLDEIFFDVVLDIKQWKTMYTVNTLAHKMPHEQKFIDAVLRKDSYDHSTSHINLNISEHIALKLFNFAALSSYGRHTFPVSNDEQEG